MIDALHGFDLGMDLQLSGAVFIQNAPQLLYVFSAADKGLHQAGHAVLDRLPDVAQIPFR